MFCKYCGVKLVGEVKYCACCGASTEMHTVAPQQPAFARTGDNAVSARKKGVRVLMLIVSVIVIFLGIGYMALAATGKTVTAQVTGYEQVLFVNNDDSTRNPSRYKLEYQFSVSGERYTGSVTRVFSGGTHMRQTISVCYLPLWPHINSEDGVGSVLVGLALTGVGILILLVEAKRKKPKIQPRTNAPHQY